MTRITRFSLDHPLLTLTALGVLSALAALGVSRLQTDAGFRSYLGSDHPSVQRLDAFIDRFGGGLPAAIVWSCEQTELCDSVFDPASLQMARVLARDLSRLPGVRRVESPATSPFLAPAADGLAIRRFVENGAPVSDRNSLVPWALGSPFWRGHLVSEDAVTGALYLELSSSDSETTATVVRAMLDGIAPFEAEGFRFHLVGDPVGFVVAADDLEADAHRLIPAMMGLIFLVAYALFRSWGQALACLATVSVALLWTFGTMGWLAWPQTAVSQALGPFVLVIGVCDAVHVLSRFAARRASLPADPRASETKLLIETADELWSACLFTSLTTAAGFLSFAGAVIQSFVRFGILAAAGVLYALLLTFSLLPVLLRTLPRAAGPTRRSSERWNLALSSLLGSVARRPRLIGVAALGLASLSLLGLQRLRVDADLVAVFGDESRVVRWRRFAESHLSSAGAIEIELVLPEGSSLRDEGPARRVSKLVARLPHIEGVTAARSVLDLTAHAERVLRDGKADGNPAGTARASTAELLFLLSLHDPALLDHWMSLDGRRVRISAEAKQSSALDSGRILREVEQRLAEAVGQQATYTVTGSFAVQYDMISEVQALQIRSFQVAWCVVLLLLAVFLRSARLALLGMIPTTLPVLLTLGVMGLWGINLDIGTAMVGAVVLGIAVDDTIHLLGQYRRRRSEGMGRREAISASVLRVGRAVVTTSAALVLGFFTMTMSAWESVASFGLLSGIAILAALLADLVVLPALVIGLDDFLQRRRA